MKTERKRDLRRALAVAGAMCASALAAPIPAASAQITPVGLPGGGVTGPVNGIGPSACPTTGSTIGPAGGTAAQGCADTLSFIAPAVGQVATTAGPTIIGGTVTVVAPITVSAGPVSVNSVP